MENVLQTITDFEQMRKEIETNEKGEMIETNELIYLSL